MTKRKREISIIVLLLCTVGIAAAQTRQTREEYVSRYKDIAIAHMERYGIPASITMAQGILESDSGNSSLASKSNNHFGIKCKSNWTGRTVSHDDDAQGECFRAYDSVEESYRDHAEFLDSSPRYDSLFSYSSSDYQSWARGLKAAGYATAPHYATSLVKIIEDEKLYLLDRENGAELFADRFESRGQIEATTSVSALSEVERVDPDNYSVTINAHNGYNIERINGRCFTRAKSGDTIESLADCFEMWKYTLRKFNDLERDAVLEQGDIIFIERKLRRWEGDQKSSHQVTSSDETLYSISQQYGVRLKSLCRINTMKSSDEITVSQIIKLK
ncbi:MAG: glucosaminidase domain-containing protein [Rikenellaceae bacterium]